MKPGNIIGLKYRILKRIGQGGYSTVFLAENMVLNNLWAVKAIDRSNPSAVDEMHEVNILKSLNHPMLPRIADLCEDERYTYIIMDYIEGETLAEILKAEGKIREPRLVEWAKQLCDVLDYLHSRQPPVIYRDLKPAISFWMGAAGCTWWISVPPSPSMSNPWRIRSISDTGICGAGAVRFRKIR